MAEHIRQRGGHDCGIAAIAMFTGRTYEETYAAGRKSDGFHPKRGTRQVGDILQELGFHWDNLTTSKPKPEGRKFRSLYLPYGIDSVLLRDWVWGRPALLSVPSLNVPGGWHMVYYDGDRVYDPQEGRRGKKFYTALGDLKPRGGHIWNHELEAVLWTHGH